MGAQANTALQVNFKTPGGTLVNVYIPEGATAGAYLEAVEGVATQIAALEAVFAGVTHNPSTNPPAYPQSAGNPPSSPSQGAPQSAPWAPAPTSPSPGVQGAAPSCVHGPRRYKEGVNKQGKPYKAWFCPSQDRNNQCPPEWVR